MNHQAGCFIGGEKFGKAAVAVENDGGFLGGVK
jgi:hypothetical protein